MARKVSAAALFTARAVLREYLLEVKIETGTVGMLATEGHAAIVVDYATNVYKIAELRPEVYFWQQHLAAHKATAPQLAGYLQKLLDAFAQVPEYERNEQGVEVALQLPLEVSGENLPRVVRLSKCAMEVTRFLRHYYKVTPIDVEPGREFDLTRDGLHIAQLAEGHLGLNHARGAVPLAQLYLERLKNGQATEKEIRVCFKQLGVLLEALPNYIRDRREEMMFVK
jgi:hypothetical protein